MAIRAGINGFGRIGRLVFRAGYKDSNINFVAVNDITDAKTLAHLLKYDSVHLTLDAEVEAKEDSFLVDGKEVKVFSEREPFNLPWKDLKVDIVVESTGIFRTYEKASEHLKAGAKKVVLTAPAKGKTPVKTIVMGINEKDYDPSKDNIISNASCTTNCVVPVAKVVHDNFKIKHVFMTTIHAYTNDQRLLDLQHKDLRRARAAGLSMIPTTTGAAKLIGKFIPELEGKSDGISIRVPTANVSIVDLACEVEKPTTVEEVKKAFLDASQGELKGYLEYSNIPLVSMDFNHSPASAIFDSLLTTVMDKTLVKVYAWYDNEWGYSCRVIDLVDYISKGL